MYLQGRKEGRRVVEVRKERGGKRGWKESRKEGKELRAQHRIGRGKTYRQTVGWWAG
jgi:hypothetical protein